MLDVDKLKKEIQTAIQNTVIPAIERIELKRMPTSSSAGNEMAKDIANTFDELVSEALADIIANAIDYYIKNMNITGMLITNGSPSTHTCTISPAPTPITGGKIPNTLGIS